jgi:hypothetical protein
MVCDTRLREEFETLHQAVLELIRVSRQTGGAAVEGARCCRKGGRCCCIFTGFEGKLQ